MAWDRLIQKGEARRAGEEFQRLYALTPHGATPPAELTGAVNDTIAALSQEVKSLRMEVSRLRQEVAVLQRRNGPTPAGNPTGRGKGPIPEIKG